MVTPKRFSKRSAVRRIPRPAKSPVPRAPKAVIDPRLRNGVDLFNSRRFFECHEVLESLWLKTDGRPRDFYKGLIQAAVAFYHWSRQNPSGALSLYRSSSRYLTRYRPEFLGLDVDGFLQHSSAVFGWLRRHHLRYDAHLVPTLRWTASIS